MLIGQLAQESGLTTKAIRFYEEQGLLQPAARTASGYRTYTEEALDRLAFVRASQALGITLGELREVIAFRDRGQTPCAHVAALLKRKAEEVDARIAEMVRLRGVLHDLRHRARDLRPEDCQDSTVCHLIPASRLPEQGAGDDDQRSPSSLRVSRRRPRPGTTGPSDRA